MRFALLALALTTPAVAQEGDPTSFASENEITAKVEAMGRAMKPGQGFAWEPLVRDGERVAALEYWKKPGRPAVHPDQAEYAVVIAGAGTLRSGGRMEGGRETQPGLVEGERIVGATERSLKPGDVMLIPAGVPHWFGITGERLVLLGTKMPAK
ncbi:cupin [Nostoc sp. 3335mG]|nr:cupin [Nostoc sp. 3335mG]